MIIILIAEYLDIVLFTEIQACKPLSVCLFSDLLGKTHPLNVKIQRVGFWGQKVFFFFQFSSIRKEN